MPQDVLGREIQGELSGAQKAELAEAQKPRVEHIRDALNELSHRAANGLAPTPDLVDRFRRLLDEKSAEAA